MIFNLSISDGNKMTTNLSIQNFLSEKNLAIVGVSRSGKKFGNTLFKELEQRGYNMFPVNPNAEEINGVKCYSNLMELKEKVGGVLICIPPEQAKTVLKDSIETNVKNVWLQQGSSSKEAIKICEENDFNYVSNECILMFAEHVNSIHKFHRWVWKILGKLPKD